MKFVHFLAGMVGVFVLGITIAVISNLESIPPWLWPVLILAFIIANFLELVEW